MLMLSRRWIGDRSWHLSLNRATDPRRHEYANKQAKSSQERDYVGECVNFIGLWKMKSPFQASLLLTFCLAMMSLGAPPVLFNHASSSSILTW